MVLKSGEEDEPRGAGRGVQAVGRDRVLVLMGLNNI